jgi:hypothetical protein
MAPHGRFLVMRYSTVIGYSGGRKIVTVAGRRSTLPDTIHFASMIRQHTLSNRAYPQGVYWIAETGKPAHRRR